MLTVGKREDDDSLGSMPTTNMSAYAKHSAVLTAFDRFASRVTRWAGPPIAFAAALASVIVWAAVGHLFHSSENWQLVLGNRWPSGCCQSGRGPSLACAHKEVARLLALEPGATLASISTYADENRIGGTAPWHYVNLPKDSCTYQAERDCPNGQCVIAAIDARLGVLD
jgi:hypothetical protein